MWGRNILTFLAKAFYIIGEASGTVMVQTSLTTVTMVHYRLREVI